MPRVSFQTLESRTEGVHDAVVDLPRSAPGGYTPVIYLTEWLTLDCRGDWASRVKHRVATVLFTDPADHQRFLAHFGPASALAAE